MHQIPIYIIVQGMKRCQKYVTHISACINIFLYTFGVLLLNNSSPYMLQLQSSQCYRSILVQIYKFMCLPICILLVKPSKIGDNYKAYYLYSNCSYTQNTSPVVLSGYSPFLSSLAPECINKNINFTLKICFL